MAKRTPPRKAPSPKRFIKQGSERPTDQAGLARVGPALNRFDRVPEVLEGWLPKRSGLSVAELVLA